MLKLCNAYKVGFSQRSIHHTSLHSHTLCGETVVIVFKLTVVWGPLDDGFGMEDVEDMGRRVMRSVTPRRDTCISAGLSVSVVSIKSSRAKDGRTREERERAKYHRPPYLLFPSTLVSHTSDIFRTYEIARLVSRDSPDHRNQSRYIPLVMAPHHMDPLIFLVP
jgi:hypothetical protein